MAESRKFCGVEEDFREHDVTKKVSIAYYPNENQEQILESYDGIRGRSTRDGYDSDDETAFEHASRDGRVGCRAGLVYGGKLCDSVPFTDAYSGKFENGARVEVGDLMTISTNYPMKSAAEKDGVGVVQRQKFNKEKVKICRVFEDVCQGIFSGN